MSLRSFDLLLSETIVNSVEINSNDSSTISTSTGHWVYSNESSSPPYIFSQKVCNNTFLHIGDCVKTAECPSDLMKWIYIKDDGNPYPRFSTPEFLQTMKNQRLMFIGCSLMRQQLLALMWTLGYENISWKTTNPPRDKKCTSSRDCFTDENHNITFCLQFMGSIATKRYNEGNYTLDHSLRGHGDSSCLLEDSMISEIGSFDLVFVQSLMWWLNLGRILDSPSSPKEWVDRMLPTVYYDAMKKLLTSISANTQTVFVLGHTGVSCLEKTSPEPFSVDNIPDNNGWGNSKKLWDTSLRLLSEERLDSIKVVDAREPLMQSVHAHAGSGGAAKPLKFNDCIHFCMNSAAVNMYLNIYWNEVFLQFIPVGQKNGSDPQN